MPLGILSEQEFDDGTTGIEVESGEQFIIYTDGVNEASDNEGNEFGLERLESVVSNNRDNVVEAVKNAVADFHSGGEQSDDISIMSLKTGSLVHRDKQSGEVVDVGAEFFSVPSFPWSFSMRLEDKDLQSTNPATQVLDFLSTIQGIAMHMDKIFTIFSELYSNALEHGILGLDSDLKNQVDGFEQYYKLREERLSNISGQSVQIDIKYIQGSPNALEINIKDSGTGFDTGKIKENVDSDDESFGRGIYLVRHLCSELAYLDGGTRVKAVYSFSAE